MADEADPSHGGATFGLAAINACIRHKADSASPDGRQENYATEMILPDLALSTAAMAKAGAVDLISYCRELRVRYGEWVEGAVKGML